MFDAKGTVNKVIVVGRLGADPELKYTPNGAAVLQLSVATNTSWKNKSGEKQEKTTWARVVAWGKLAETIAQYAKKGNLVYVEGRLDNRTWEDKDGIKRYITDVVANSIQLLGNNKREEAPLPADPNETSFESNSSEPVVTETEEDIPF